MDLAGDIRAPNYSKVIRYRWPDSMFIFAFWAFRQNHSSSVGSLTTALAFNAFAHLAVI